MRAVYGQSIRAVYLLSLQRTKCSIFTGVVFLLVVQDELNRVKLKGWEVGGLQALIGTTHFILSKEECDSCHNWAVCVSSNTISA